MLKIYFAYSGRDKEGRNPVQDTISYLTQNHNVIATQHSWSPIASTDKSILQKIRIQFIKSPLRAMFLRSHLLKWFALFINWALGPWFIVEIARKLNIQDWRFDANKYIEESDILVFLFSRNSENKWDAENIIWEIETAKRLNRNVITCPLEPEKMKQAPSWVEKVNGKTENFTPEDLLKQIKYHNLKEYRITSDNIRSLASEPDSRTAERMFEQYKIYKDETGKLIETRQTVSNYYLLMNGALLTLIGVVLNPEHLEQNLPSIGVVLFFSSIVGIVLSNLWLDMVNYYKNLNTAKQRMINAIEEYLPLRLNATEYYDIMRDPLNKGRYKSFGESVIPNTIHAGWGVMFLASTTLLLILLGRYLLRFSWGCPVLFTLLISLLLEPILEFTWRSHTRVKTRKRHSS